MEDRFKVMALTLGFLYIFSTGSGPQGDVVPWPKTLDATVEDILAGMSAEDKKIIRSLEKEQLIQYHHGWGTDIRNEYGLWRGNEALMVSACGRPCLPDTASMYIIEAVWAALQESPY